MVGTNRKILFIGTLGSGKTTFSRMVSETLNYPLISIDDCRTEFGDNTVTGEYVAWTNFIKACNDKTPVILEFSGGGPHVYAVRYALLQSTLPVHLFWLDPPLDICIKRASSRISTIPTPYPWAPIHESVPSIYKGIEIAWNTYWTTEPTIAATRLKLDGTELIDDVYSQLLGFWNV